MAQQGQQRTADLARSGVVAADDQVADHGDDLVVRQPIAGLLGVEERADEVVTAPIGAGSDHPLDVDHQLDDRRLGARDLVGVHEAEDRAQRVAECDEVGDLVVGHAEQAADHRDRDRGKGFDEVAATGGDEVVIRAAVSSAASSR